MKLERTKEYIDSLTFHTPPEERGQMVQYAFAQGDAETIIKVSDYSKLNEYYKVVEIFGDKFEPWNSCPSFQALHEEQLVIID
jgi:hypothetical protein